MGIIYLMQMLTVGFILLLAIPLVTSRNITTSKEEIRCENCTPIPYASPPPPVIECPPPPSPPSPPPPSPMPPACLTCPPRPCIICQIPNTPIPVPPRPDGQQPGVIGGDVYPPPNGVVPYFPYGSPSAASSIQLGMRFVVSIIFLLLSAHFQLLLIN